MRQTMLIRNLKIDSKDPNAPHWYFIRTLPVLGAFRDLANAPRNSVLSRKVKSIIKNKNSEKYRILLTNQISIIIHNANTIFTPCTYMATCVRCMYAKILGT